VNRMSSGTTILVLALLLGLQPVTTDLYLPALPAMTTGFGAPMSQAQLTLSGLVLAFGLSQMIWGPLSDCYGRRPILLIGMTAYVLASIGSAFSLSMEQLIGWRVVQGIAMGAAVVIARSIVRDLFDHLEGARVMSKGLTGLGIFACLSAPMGGILTEFFGWRSALLALAIFGAVVLAVMIWRLEETLVHRNPQAMNPKVMIRNWATIIKNKSFWAFALLTTMSYGGLFTFLASSSFVYIEVLEISQTRYGLIMLSSSLAYISGTFLCRWLLKRMSLKKTIRLGGFISIAAGSAQGLLAVAGIESLPALLIPWWFYMVGHGIHQPCGQSGAVSPFPQMAGAASALSGLIMMTVAFGIGLWLGVSLADVAGESRTVLPMTNGIWFWSVLLAVVALLLVQRHKENH
jgi:DHA1 family bicyclomycin/chloramphenicol resistance-like MFS transporter